MPDKKPFNFEEAIAELEQLVDQLGQCVNLQDDLSALSNMKDRIPSQSIGQSNLNTTSTDQQGSLGQETNIDE